MKKKIYIAGTDKLSFFLQDLLDPDKIDFRGYVTFNDDFGTQFVRGGYSLITIEQLDTMEFDYLLICEDIDFDRSDIRKVSFRECLSIVSMYLGPDFYICRKKALSDMQKESTCGIITGMSYTQRGINTEQMSKKMCMGACPSQDLYYDFFVLADAVKRMGKRLQYAVLGLAPFSFRYDLSLSDENYAKCLFYYREFGEWHNATFGQGDLERMEYYDAVVNELCIPNWRNICFNFLCDDPFKQSEQIFDYEVLDTEQQQKVLALIKRIGNKPYPDTVIENKMVFDMCLKLCNLHNIKVTVLIPPFSNFFREHFTTSYIAETRDIIREYQEKYRFEILDLYEAPDFSENKFYSDEEHLNAYGAVKLTETLDEFMKDKVYSSKER